jgi:hypothetical protein
MEMNNYHTQHKEHMMDYQRIETLESKKQLTRDDLVIMLHNARDSHAILLMKYELLAMENETLTEKLAMVSGFMAKHKIKIK